MKKNELIEWYKSIDSEKLPRYIDATDANNSQFCINGEWRNVFFSWSVFSIADIWKYAETDGDRGYIFDLKCFETEEEAVEYAKEILSKKHLASKGNTKEEMLCRHIQQKYGYSEKQAKVMIEQMRPRQSPTT